MKFDTKAVCIVDSGMFNSLAVTLAKSFGKVGYFSEWRTQYPTSNSQWVGRGLPGVKRIDSVLAEKDDYDLFIFTDLYQADLQLELEEQGKRVFGSRNGEELEIYRDDAKKLFEKLKLSVGDWMPIKGMDMLREYLKQNENVYVKANTIRGTLETFKSKNYKLIKPHLDQIELDLGAAGKVQKFVVEHHIDCIAETGFDGIIIDGQEPNIAFCGVETKDAGYVMHAIPYAKLAPEISGFNAAIAPTLKKYRYRNWMSTEIRVTDKRESCMIDFCGRRGSPPSEGMDRMIKNLSAVLWEGAEGNRIDIELEKEWSAQAVISAYRRPGTWQSVYFPDNVKDNVTFFDHAIIDKTHYIVPQPLYAEGIGWVIGTGNTMEDAIEQCKEFASQIKGLKVDVSVESLDKAVDAVNELKEAGITI